MAQAPAVQVVYSPERARDMVVETHADLLALSAAVDDDWASSAQTPDAARAGLDALIARHEKLPTFQIAWHLVSDIDAAATKAIADKITATLNARIRKSGSNRIALAPRFVG